MNQLTGKALILILPGLSFGKVLFIIAAAVSHQQNSKLLSEIPSQFICCSENTLLLSSKPERISKQSEQNGYCIESNHQQPIHHIQTELGFGYSSQ